MVRAAAGCPAYCSTCKSLMHNMRGAAVSMHMTIRYMPLTMQCINTVTGAQKRCGICVLTCECCCTSQLAPAPQLRRHTINIH